MFKSATTVAAMLLALLFSSAVQADPIINVITKGNDNKTNVTVVVQQVQPAVATDTSDDVPADDVDEQQPPVIMIPFPIHIWMGQNNNRPAYAPQRGMFQMGMSGQFGRPRGSPGFGPYGGRGFGMSFSIR